MHSRDNLKTYILLILILAFAGSLRLFHLNAESLWYDETATFRVADKPVSEVLTDRVHDISNPPLYFILVHYWIQLLDSRSEWAARSLSVLFGLLGIMALYLVGAHWFDQRLGLSAALIMAVSPTHIYFSQEARTYTLLIFLSILSFYCFKRLIVAGTRWSFFGYGLSAVALIYAHNYGLLIIIVQFIYLNFFTPLTWRKKLICNSAFLLIGIAYLPWLLVLIRQIAQRAEQPEIDYFMRENWYQHLLALPYYLTVGRTLAWREAGGPIFLTAVTLVTGVLILPVWKGLTLAWKKEPLAVFWLVGIILLALLITMLVITIFSTLYLSILLPVFALILAQGLIALYRSRRIFYLELIILSVLVVLSLTRLYFHPQKQDWRGATAFIEQQITPGEAVLLHPEYLATPLNYYLKQPRPQIPLKYPSEKYFRGTPLETELTKLSGLWLLIYDNPRYLTPQLKRELHEFFPQQQRFEFYKVGLVHCWK